MRKRGFARVGFSLAIIASTLLAGATLTGAAGDDGDRPGDAGTSDTAGVVAPQVVRQSTTYKVVNITRTYNSYGTQELARCDGSNGTHCSIGKSKTAARTIQTSFGLTRATVAGGLSITSAASVEVTVSCSHTVTSKQVYVAYPIGTKYTYRIQKVVSTFNGISTSKNTTYSSYLTAFSPGSASIHCVLKSK
jgi:hypothetical protein